MKTMTKRKYHMEGAFENKGVGHIRIAAKGAIWE